MSIQKEKKQEIDEIANDYKEILEHVEDWTTRGIRDDLIAAKGIEMGDIIGVTPKPGKNWTDAVSFEIGDTHIWQAGIRGEKVEDGCLGWQIADLIDGHFTNHRGFSSDVIESFSSVLKEQNKISIDSVSLEGIKKKAVDEQEFSQDISQGATLKQ